MILYQSYIEYAKAQLAAAKTDAAKEAWTELLAEAERELAKQQANYCID